MKLIWLHRWSLRLAAFAVVGIAVCFGFELRADTEPKPSAPFGMDLPLRRLSASERPITETLPSAVWYDSEWGWIVVADDEAALEAASDLRAAAAAFYLHFGVMPGRGLVIDARFAALAGPLRQVGALWSIPWSFDSISNDRVSASGQSSAARLVGAGLCDPLPDLASTLNDSETVMHSERDDGHHPDERAGLRHEIGHALFLTFIMPGPHRDQYGSDAPDWLDEAAAELMETPAVVQLRRLRFAQEANSGRLPPLSTILTQTHPLFASKPIAAAVAEARRRQSEGPLTLTISLDASGVAPDTVADFYANARAAADFLIDQSGDVRILSRIAADFRSTGQPMSWLGDLDNLGHVPRTIEALNKAFADWAYGQMGS